MGKPPRFQSPLVLLLSSQPRKADRNSNTFACQLIGGPLCPRGDGRLDFRDAIVLLITIPQSSPPCRYLFLRRRRRCLEDQRRPLVPWDQLTSGAPQRCLPVGIGSRRIPGVPDNKGVR